MTDSPAANTREDAPVIIDSSLHETARLFKNIRVRNSTLSQEVIIGDNSRIDESQLAPFVRIDRNNHLFRCTLGRYTYTGMNSVFMGSQIGAFCSISWGVTIGPPNHDISRVSSHAMAYKRFAQLNNLEAPLYDRFARKTTVGSDVWIGCSSTVLQGVHIGHGAVVGANSVVTSEVPPYAVVAGAPARIIRYRFDDEIISLLLKLEWWSWSDDKIKTHFDLLTTTPDLPRLLTLLNT